MHHSISHLKTILCRDTLAGCLLFAGVTLALSLGADCSLAHPPTQTPVSPQANQEQVSQEEIDGAKLDAGFDLLVKEIDNLLPGGMDQSPERKEMVEQAVRAFQTRQGGQVIEIFNRMTATDPYLPPSDLLLASLNFVANDKTTGKKLLERAASQHPQNLGVSAVFARLAISEGRIADGVAHLEKLERLLNAPEVSGEVRKYYAQQYLDGKIDVAMRLERYAEARPLLELQRSQFPESSKVQLVSAELEFRENNIPKSLEYLQALKDKNPQARAPESIIASWYLRTGDKASSDKWLIEAVSKYPQDPPVLLDYASLMISKEEFELANQSIATAEQNSKETSVSQSLKAKIAFAKGSFANAAIYYQAIISANPANIEAANMLALSLIENADEGIQKKALELASNNFRRAPNNLVTRSALGYIQLRLGNLEQAQRAFGAKAKVGASPDIDFFMASVLQAMDQKENARRVLGSTVKYEGFFLYRRQANQMLSELGGPLPAPATKTEE